MVRDKAEQQKRRAQEMLGISDERAKEIFEEQPDRKQQKKKELEKEGKLETQEEPETQENDTSQADYQEVVSGTIDDAKEQLLEMENPDYEAALKAEKNNKDRTTFIDWLESKLE